MKKISTVALGLVATVGCNAMESADTSNMIRVMTYNIQSGKGMDKKIDLERTAGPINRANPLIVGLQEVDVKTRRSGKLDMPAILGTKLTMQSAFAQAMPHDGGSYGNAVLSKTPFTVVDSLMLPTAKGAEPRVVLIVKVEQPRPFYFMVSHLSWEAQYTKERIEGVQNLKKLIDEKKYTPAIFVGDFNEGIKGAVVNELRKDWTIVNDVNPMPSFNAKNPKTTLDYICFYPKTAFNVISCRVCDEPEASDHRPVIAEFQFTP